MEERGRSEKPRRDEEQKFRIEREGERERASKVEKRKGEKREEAEEFERVIDR